MDKKKKAILLFTIVVLIALFLIWFLPKFWVIHNHFSKVSKAEQETNIYIKMKTYKETGNQITELLQKDGTYVLKATMRDEQDQPITYIEWSDSKTRYSISEKNKTASYDTNVRKKSWLSHTKLLLMETASIWDEIRLAFEATITSDMANGKPCNLVKIGSTKYWIETETGLLVSCIEGYENITIYEYHFGEITDDQVRLPDLTGYKVEKANQIQ